MKSFISAVHLLCKYAAIASNQLQSINKTFFSSQAWVCLLQKQLAMKKEISEPVVKKNCGYDVPMQAVFIFCAVYRFSFATNKT